MSKKIGIMMILCGIYLGNGFSRVYAEEKLSVHAYEQKRQAFAALLVQLNTDSEKNKVLTSNHRHVTESVKKEMDNIMRQNNIALQNNITGQNNIVSQAGS